MKYAPIMLNVFRKEGSRNVGQAKNHIRFAYGCCTFFTIPSHRTRILTVLNLFFVHGTIQNKLGYRPIDFALYIPNFTNFPAISNWFIRSFLRMDLFRSNTTVNSEQTKGIENLR